MTVDRMPRLYLDDFSRLPRALPQGWFWNLWMAACEASTRAYAPYSNFFVGAAVVSLSGKIYSGCNVECLDYDGTHAEESAFSAMVMGEDYKASAVLCVVRRGSPSVPAELTVPCGKCRQKILEFGMADETIVLIVDSCGDDSFVVAKTIGELLPRAFIL